MGILDGILGGGGSGGGLLGGILGGGGSGGGGGLLGGLLGGGGGSGGGGLLGGILGGGGGGGLGGMLGGLPIVGGLLGGGGGGQQMPGGGQLPYGPGAWTGWPVPQARGGQPQQQFQGDFSKPGQGESFYGANKDFYTTRPNAQQYWQDKGGGGQNQGGEYWEGIKGRSQNPPGGSNYATEAYQSFKGSQPASMEAFYDNALRRSNEDIDRSYGARGMLGSSRSMDRKAEASTDLRSQQARDEAQYGLQRGGLMGSLGQGADASGRANTGMDLSWLTGLGGLGLGVQNAGLQRQLGLGNLALGVDAGNRSMMDAGMNAALGAQGAQRARGQDYFGNNLALGGQQAGLMNSIFQPAIGQDLGLLQAQLDLMLGRNREAANQVTQGRAASEEGIGNFMGLFGSMMGGGGLGGMMG